jgi:hypothetical protein
VSGSVQVARAALRNRALRATLVAFLSSASPNGRAGWRSSCTASTAAARLGRSERGDPAWCRRPCSRRSPRAWPTASIGRGSCWPLSRRRRRNGARGICDGARMAVPGRGDPVGAGPVRGHADPADAGFPPAAACDHAGRADSRQRHRLVRHGQLDPRGAGTGRVGDGGLGPERHTHRGRSAPRGRRAHDRVRSSSPTEGAGPSEPADLLEGFRQVARKPGAALVLLLLGLQAITWGARSS